MSDETDTIRAAHGARTQSLFRDVNERVRQINDVFSAAIALGDWVCECANDGCTERVAVSPADYERVRSNAARFIVRPAQVHVDPDIEQSWRRKRPTGWWRSSARPRSLPRGSTRALSGCEVSGRP